METKQKTHTLAVAAMLANERGEQLFNAGGIMGIFQAYANTHDVVAIITDGFLRNVERQVQIRAGHVFRCLVDADNLQIHRHSGRNQAGTSYLQSYTNR